MYLAYAIFGLILGGMVANSGGHYLLGALGGAAIGIVLARLAQLDARVRQLESSANALQRDHVATSPRPSPGPEPATGAEPPESAAVPVDPWQRPADVPAPSRAVDEVPPPVLRQTAESPPGLSAGEPVPLQPSILQSMVKTATAWIGSGNVPVKVGVIISFFGVAFLLKYAIDRELMIIPLEFRLLAVAAAGAALIVIGWRLRRKMSVYGLSLQGGGLGILYLTIFAALRLWQLLPATLAFFLLVALTVFTGALAVLQNARMLALLGIAGGFLAPVLTSTGQGSHVALFSYYLVLNLAILGISWFRAWRELNLAGFVFTFVIGSFWGYRYYKPTFFHSTEPFLVLHFLLYQAIAILYALRQAPKRIGAVDGTLVFATPIVAFALQAALVRNTEYGLAISAAAVAVFYALTATGLWRRQGVYLRLLTESFLALAVAFATITLPLALDARWTSAAWALEGAALVWLGTRQGRLLPKFTGTGLIFFSGAAFLLSGWRSDAGPPVLNGNVLGGVLISLSAFFASRQAEKPAALRFQKTHRIAAVALFVWAALWWLGTGWTEISDRAIRDRQPALFMLFLALSMGATALLSERLRWTMARAATMLYLPALLLLVPRYLEGQEHFLRGLGWLAWPLTWVVQFFVLRLMDRHDVAAGGRMAWCCLAVAYRPARLGGRLVDRSDRLRRVGGRRRLGDGRSDGDAGLAPARTPRMAGAGPSPCLPGRQRGAGGRPGNLPGGAQYHAAGQSRSLALCSRTQPVRSRHALRHAVRLACPGRAAPGFHAGRESLHGAGRAPLPADVSGGFLCHDDVRAGARRAPLHRRAVEHADPVPFRYRACRVVDLLGPARLRRNGLGRAPCAPAGVAGGGRIHGAGGDQAVPGRPRQYRHAGAHRFLHRYWRFASGGRLFCAGAAAACRGTGHRRDSAMTTP